MERSFGSLKFGVGGSVCSTCGKVFETPLLAMVFSDYMVEEYYACPKCLSKVRDIKRREPVEVDVAETESAGMAVEGGVEEVAGCAHHLGFLKVRPKNTPIPEECLTCSKMIECMY
jgi:DNA-directed RNA polymerase subunit RPC12/RpoP